MFRLRGSTRDLAIAIALALVFAGGAPLASAAEEEPAARKPNRVKHTSGLIVVVEPGAGAPIKKGQTAVVHYTGWLDKGGWEKGEKFDSSRDRGKPFSVTNVGSARVIQGWNDGIAPHGSLSGMRVGEKRQLLIPARLGYGARGAGAKIPPNSRLIFDVELLEIR
jgi:peptidylprolyl isomerase